MTYSTLFAELVERSGKKQMQIAAEAGFDKPNIITMFKQGKSKIPPARIPALAKSLGVDPLFLYREVMRADRPEKWAMLEALVGAQLSQLSADVCRRADSPVLHQS